MAVDWHNHIIFGMNQLQLRALKKFHLKFNRVCMSHKFNGKLCLDFDLTDVF